jgi:hypothetical protein
MNDPRSSFLNLQATARQVMQAQGFQPVFLQRSKQLADIKAHPPPSDASRRSVTFVICFVFDYNDNVKDLDQIEVAERLPNGDISDRHCRRGRFCRQRHSIDQHAEGRRPLSIPA